MKKGASNVSRSEVSKTSKSFQKLADKIFVAIPHHDYPQPKRALSTKTGLAYYLLDVIGDFSSFSNIWRFPLLLH